MANFATPDDLAVVWKALSTEEKALAGEVMTTLSALIRSKAHSVGKDFDMMCLNDANTAQIAKSVICDATRRYIEALNQNSAAGQISQSVGGYSVSLTPTLTGGGAYLLDNEFKRLGIQRQRIRFVDMAGD